MHRDFPSVSKLHDLNFSVLRLTQDPAKSDCQQLQPVLQALVFCDGGIAKSLSTQPPQCPRPVLQ